MKQFILFLLIVIIFGVESSSDVTSCQYTGFVGCHLSPSVCKDDEICVDDHLFGTCQSSDERRDLYGYSLQPKHLELLEGEIRRLIQLGYTWQNLYTQCVLGNILLGFRCGVAVDPTLCDIDRLPSQEDADLTSDVVGLLEKYFKDYYDDLASQQGQQDVDLVDIDGASQLEEVDLESKPISEDYDGESLGNDIEKKDSEYSDIVSVHKYQKSHKRYPSATELENDEGEGTDGDSNNAEFGSERSFADLQPEDIQVLDEYLEKVGEDKAARKRDEDRIEDMFSNVDTGTNNEMALEESGKGAKESVVVTPEDAHILGQLLAGQKDVSDLDREQIVHLSKVVENLIENIREEDEEEKEAVSDILESSLSESSMLPEPIKKDLPVASPTGEIEDLDNIDKHDHPIDDPLTPPPTPPRYEYVDASYAYIVVEPENINIEEAVFVLETLAHLLHVPPDTFAHPRVNKGKINFKVEPNERNLNATVVASEAKLLSAEILNKTTFAVKQSGIGHDQETISLSEVEKSSSSPKYLFLTVALCGTIAGIVLAVVIIYIVRRHNKSKEKLAQLGGAPDGNEASKDYQDLCRQRMLSKSSDKPEPIHVAAAGRISSTTSEAAVRSPSSRSSTSSWSEEPVASNMDITTGHIVLSYMEDHLKNKNRLDLEWDSLCSYIAEPNATTVAMENSNLRKNRYGDILPYDHSRVTLHSNTNVSGSDYINASTITDHDPRNPAYIVTQGPLPHTVADFWQMIWEHGCVVIVNLTKLTENGVVMSHRYWPEEGSDLYHIYEVHLVSEHIWCDDYLVRSFYLKNLQTSETRTVTQFYFLTWPDLGIPGSTKALLEFRRKVNKSFRGRSSPVVVHCSDGAGRSGTYVLVDMVLNRMNKGAKEIDIAATLEHIRDQRMQMVKTKEQFEFALAAVAEEVHAILKALPQ